MAGFILAISPLLLLIAVGLITLGIVALAVLSAISCALEWAYNRSRVHYRIKR